MWKRNAHCFQARSKEVQNVAGSAGAEKQCVFSPGDEGGRGQIEDQTAIHLRVEGEIEVVERVVRVAEGGLFPPSLD
jgi:hypothetical protein